MGAGIHNVYEDEEIRWSRPATGRVSIEINATCPFSVPDACGSRCFLQARKAPTGRFDAERIYEAFDEILESGHLIRHFGVPGMEPLATPEILFGLLERYHGRAPDARPRTFNIITSGYQLNRFKERFQDLWIDGLYISVDDFASSNLRSAGSGRMALESGLAVRALGGCRKLCVNTVFTGDNSEAVLAIAKSLKDCHVDQMVISPMMHSNGSRMVSSVSESRILEFAEVAAADRLIDGLTILIEVQPATLAFASKAESIDWEGEWSARYQMADSNVYLLAINKDSPFLRIRWDGQILTQDEFLKVGLQKSSAGEYRSGCLSKAISRWLVGHNEVLNAS